MLVRVLPAFFAAAAMVAFLGPPLVADAADYTDLLDAADDFDDDDPDTFDPWDFNIEPSFRYDYGTANISREAPCVPNEPSNQLEVDNPRLVVDNTRCNRPRIISNKEMDYLHTRSTLDLTLRAGLYKDLELRVTIPYVLSSTRGLRYAQPDDRGNDGVTEGNSSVDPSTSRIQNHADDVFRPDQTPGSYTTSLDQYQLYRFFELGSDYQTIERSGLGDPTLGIHWAPWNDQRDDTKATLLLGMDYLMPLAEIQEAENSAVGRGVHELSWKVAASKKFQWFEPYFGAEYFLPLPAQNSLYGRTDSIQNQGQGQVLINPPQRGLFTVGTEIIPYEEPENDVRYSFDLRFQFGYVSEGRDYTPLFDHMTDPDNECNRRTIESVRPVFDDNHLLTNPDDVACAWVIRQPSNADGPAVYDLEDAINAGDNTDFAFTDLMSVDSYGTFGGQLGVHLQPSSYFQFRGVVGMTHHQSHLLTNARTGRDSDDTPQDSVSMAHPSERNPAYNPSYDNSGSRFQVQRFNTWHFMVTTALQF